MSEPEEAERLNREGVLALGERLEEGPVVMLNLLAFKPDGGAERYAEYTTAVTPLLERVGGRIVFAGTPSPALIGDARWDLVALAEYPTRQAFMDMIGSDDYEAIAHLRTEALTDSGLIPLDPVDPEP